MIKRLIAEKKALLILSGLFFMVILTSGNVLAQNPTADFTSNTTTGCSPLTVNFTNLSTQADVYAWDFGNGNTSTLQNPTTVYTSSGSFTVRLIAINSLTGNRDTIIAVDYIFVPTDPITDFTAVSVTGCAKNDAIAFTNLSTNAASYIWDFGDGNFSNAVNPTHIYSNAGTYTVKLIAANSYGCTKVKTKTAYITIHPNPPAAFTVNQQSSCDQNQIFTFTSTTPGATGWIWTFGDGNSSTVQNPVHTYTNPGSYNVTLIVFNSFGCSDTTTQQSFINIGPTLVPTFSVNSQTGCVPFSSVFTSTVVNATSWLWDFGDGTTSTLENPTHVYAASGNYTITLTVTTTSGCNGTVSLPAFISVEAMPVAQFIVTNAVGCKPHLVAFTNNSIGAISYVWDFGNGQNSTVENPVNLYSSAGIYNVTLSATSPNGCVSFITIDSAVTVNQIVANFTATPRIGCASLPVDFTASSTPPAASWSWDFGNGVTSTSQIASTTYNAIGNYNVTLIATSAEGCKDTIVKPNYIKVVTDVTPYTVPDTIIVCLPPGTVSFTDPTIGSNSWLWDFGDGNTSTAQNPVHAYLAPGIYTVTLTTGMAGGCTQVFNPFAYIKVLPFVTSPIVSLIVSPCGPFTVQLDNLTLDVASYLWNFGDGNTSTLQNPVHTYTQQGTYNISLTLTAINGCQTSLSTTVTFGHVNPITISNPDICLGDDIVFGLNPLSDFVSAVWDFGDGTTSNQLQPTHVYTSIGIYIVSVTIVDTDGCTFSYTSPVNVIISNPIPLFVVNQATTGCVNFLVAFTNTSTGATSYSWDFGNGNTSVSIHPTQNYTVPGVYSVTLTATANGCVRSLTVPNMITAHQAFADFSFTPTTGCLPITVSFTDLSTNAVSWLWDFGDGNTSTLQNPVYTFVTNPTGNVKLTIVDVNGCTKTRTKSNINPVIPQINVNDSIGCRPLLVNFSTNTSAATYLWDFGDGTTSNIKNPTHLYTQAGLFTVTLTCTLASGCTTSTVKPDFISVNAPLSEFMSPTVSVCAPSLVNFVNQSSGATAWLWDFGDGTSSTSENPAHIYNIPGTYTVSLISYSAAGCTDTIVKIDYIVVPGTYTYFVLGSDVNCFNSIVQFVDSSINATSWFWNFGDGFTSTLQNPGHLYADSGSYIVTLIASDNTGCQSFYSFPIPVIVHPIPVASATIGAAEGCQPLEVNFVNNSTGGNGYMWHFGNNDSTSVGDTLYTYNNPGTFSPYLVVSNSVGCSDTVSFPDGVIVHQIPQAAFTLSDTEGCAPFQISFTNTSGDLTNPVYSWDFGNGTVSSLTDPDVIFSLPGLYDVTLIVTNTGGCSDTITSSVTIHQPPIAQGVISAIAGCSPFVVDFSDSSLFSSSILWHFGNGDTSSASIAQQTYTVAGSYNPFLVAYSSEGCTDTLHFNGGVEVHPVPQSAFSIITNAACPGTEFQLINQSTPSTGLSFNWNIAGIISSSENPSLILSNPGFYNVSLIVTNQFGCTDSLFETNYLQVFDTLPPAISPILSVSVINNSEVEIIWQNNSALDLGAYVLYRKNLSTGLFNEIYRDTTPSNSSLFVSSSYTDTGLNTLQNVYTYILQTLDICAYTIPLSQLTPHTTINVTALPFNNDIRVTWTPYIGCSVLTYELNRINLVTGVASQIATVPGNTLSFLDVGFYCPHEYSYRITATELCGSSYTSLSDTSIAKPVNTLANQSVEVVRSTVIDDTNTLTEWKPPILEPQRVKEYRILRSTNKLNYTEVEVVPSNVLSYIDSRADVHNQEYYYKVEVISDCEIAGAPSNTSSSILLKGEHKNDKTKLWWTPYFEWDTGVDYYYIEKLNRVGQWERVRKVTGNEINSTLDE